MDHEILLLLREWIQAEIKAAIVDSKPDSGGYYGTGYEENKQADKLFERLCLLNSKGK